MKNLINKVTDKEVAEYFSNKLVLDHYTEATLKVGLWQSEEEILVREFANQESKLLELGCGTGRISFGLFSLGYRNLIATDFSRAMIRRAQYLDSRQGTNIKFKVEDATSLSLEDGIFDGVIFGFNGLMQIPRRENRFNAMKEIFRVLRKGGKFVFTTHDQSLPKWKKFWRAERLKWKKQKQDPRLNEFGDRFDRTEKGMLYIHVPEISEIRKDLCKAGFVVEKDLLRSRIREESVLVNQFSDECRFWIARKN